MAILYIDQDIIIIEIRIHGVIKLYNVIIRQKRNDMIVL